MQVQVEDLLARFERERLELEAEEQNTIKHCQKCDKEIYVGDEIGTIFVYGQDSQEVCGTCYKYNLITKEIRERHERFMQFLSKI